MKCSIWHYTVGWPVAPLIQLDCRIPWSSIYLEGINHCHGDNHQEKVASETTSFDWLWWVAPLVQSNCKILCSSICLERINGCLSFFCMDLVINIMQHLTQPLLVGFGKVCLLFNQIAGFFDHQYLSKESICILDFLHGFNHQGKVASEIITFSWVWLGVPLD